MADSTVTFTDIDEEFPVAGQDNDSQGFRDNFREIKTSLQSANGELSTLLTNSARLDQTNDFNGNLVNNASTRSISAAVYNTGNINQDTTLEWTDGMYQNVTVDTDVTLILGGWPATGEYGKFKMAIRSANPGTRITWEAANGGTLRVNSIAWPADANDNFITTTEIQDITSPIFIEAWTTDGGQTVYLNYMGIYEEL
jgi:hypothetical protein